MSRQFDQCSGRGRGFLSNIKKLRKGVTGWAYEDLYHLAVFKEDVVDMHAKNRITEILSLIRDSSEKQGRNDKQFSKVLHLLDQCCKVSSVDSVVSHVEETYDILQRAVGAGNVDLVKDIIGRGYNIKLVNRTCSSPLHLACQRGDVYMVKVFLDHGAEVGYKSALCFPCPHNSPTRCTKEYPRHYQIQKGCSRERWGLLAIVLSKDAVSMLQLLLSHRKSRDKLDTRNILQQACKYKAVQCLRYLTPLFPLQTARRYGRDSLLGIAVRKSEACFSAMLEAGVKWDRSLVLDCNGRGDNALHLYYSCQQLEKSLETTKLVMDTTMGWEDINHKDMNGNTALHILLRQVGRRVSLPLLGQLTNTRSIREEHQQNYDDQVFSTFRYIVEHGANVHAVNAIGENSLHALLSDNFHRCLHNLSAGNYNDLLPQVSRVLEYLLSAGVDANGSSARASPPLTWAAHILISMEAFQVENAWPPVNYLLTLLCEYGADPNALDERDISMVSLLLTAANRWLTQCSSENDMPRASCILRHVHSVLKLFFHYGFTPNDEILDLFTKQLAILCNVNVTDPCILAGIGRILLPLLQNGIDPHSLRVVYDYEHLQSAPCKLHAQFYLARAFIIHRNQETMLSFFPIFENSLQQESLNNMVKSLSNIIASNFKEDIHDEVSGCAKNLERKGRNARPLKVLCRATVALSLQWKLQERVPCLPLPKLMKDYILNLDR